MGVAVREHDDVAGDRAAPTARPRSPPSSVPGGDDVVLHDVLDAAQQQRRDLPRRRRLGDPAAVAADREEDGAAQAHVAQDVGERVVVHSVRSGVSVKPAGRAVKAASAHACNGGRKSKSRRRRVVRANGQRRRMNSPVARCSDRRLPHSQRGASHELTDLLYARPRRPAASRRRCRGARRPDQRRPPHRRRRRLRGGAQGLERAPSTAARRRSPAA